MSMKRNVSVALLSLMATGVLSGCAGGQIPQYQQQNSTVQTDRSSTDREAELQAEVDALRQEIDTLKNNQTANSQSGDTAGQTAQDDTSQSSASQQEGTKQESGTTQQSGTTQESQTSQQSGTSQQNGTTQGQASQNTTTNNNAAQPSQGYMASANVAISMEEAKSIALSRVQGATEQNMSIKLDFDDGWYVYEGEIMYNGMEYEFDIDANSGTILKWESERW